MTIKGEELQVNKYKYRDSLSKMKFHLFKMPLKHYIFTNMDKTKNIKTL